MDIAVEAAACGSAYAAPRISGLWWMPDVASKSGEPGGVFILTQVVYIQPTS